LVASIRDSLVELVFGSGDQKAPIPSRGAELVFGANTGAGTRFAAASAKRQLEAYAGKNDAIDIVMSGLNVIGETASHGKKIPKDREEADANERLAPSDLIELLEHPNPYMDYEEFIELILIDWILTGDFFILKFGIDPATQKPLALYRLSPALVEVVPGTSEFISKYRYSVPGMSPVEFDAEDIVHAKRPNPHDPYRGAGIISGGPGIYDMELALTNTKANFFLQGAKLSGVLETDRAVNDGMLAKVRKQFMGLYSGSDNAYKVAVLERGLKFNSIQATAVEAEFGAMTDSSLDRIFAALRVPRSMLGMGAPNARVGLAEDDRRTFANSTMRPLLNKLQKALTKGIVKPGWGLDFCIEYEYQMPIEAQINLATNFATLPGVKIKEVREFVNLPPLGDKRDDLVLNLPGDNTNSSGVKDRPLGTEPGRPPNGANTSAVPADGSLPADAAAQYAK
jgi:HK97 family phage portal protein